MRRFLMVCLLAGGCSTHSVEPRGDYADPENIPVVFNIIVIPGPGGNFNVTWDYDDAWFEIVDGFGVERAPFADGEATGAFLRLNAELLQQREYEDLSNLPEGGYVYRVVSETAAGVSRASSWAVAYVDVDPPPAPVLFLEILTGPAPGVRLEWTRPAEDVVGYRLFRVPEFFAGLPFLEVAGQFYEDAGLTPGVTYNYWVKAVDQGLNESPNSNIEAVQLAP